MEEGRASTASTGGWFTRTRRLKDTSFEKYPLSILDSSLYWIMISPMHNLAQTNPSFVSQNADGRPCSAKPNSCSRGWGRLFSRYKMKHCWVEQVHGDQHACVHMHTALYQITGPDSHYQVVGNVENERLHMQTFDSHVSVLFLFLYIFLFIHFFTLLLNLNNVH